MNNQKLVVLKSHDEIVNYMHTRWPDKGTSKERKENLYFRMGFYECYKFVNGDWDTSEAERKIIVKSIYDKLSAKNI